MKMWGNRKPQSSASKNVNVTAILKTVWQFLAKLNIFLLYDSAIVLLDIYPEMYIHTKSALFTVKAWKQPQCPSIDE